MAAPGYWIDKLTGKSFFFSPNLVWITSFHVFYWLKAETQQLYGAKQRDIGASILETPQAHHKMNIYTFTSYLQMAA